MGAVLTFAGPPGAVDELGVWLPLARPEGVALGFAGFDAAGHGGPLPGRPKDAAVRPEWDDALRGDGILWRVDAGVGGVELAVAKKRLALAALALPQAEGRAAILASTRGQVAGVAVEQAGPERDLLEWARLAPADPEQFARRADVRAAAAQVAAFFEKVRAAVSSYAAVVTRLDGQTVAVTQVSWTGDFRAAWLRGLRLDEVPRHQDAVTLALRTRDLWLRLAATVLAGAFQLAALFAANPLLALPAAYRFVTQVIEQAQGLVA